MSQPIAGVANFKLGDLQLPLAGDVEIRVANENRESKMDMQGKRVGHSVEYVPQGFDMTVYNLEDTDLTKLQADYQEVTAQVELNNRTTYVARNADIMTVDPIDASSGTYKIKVDCDELQRLQ